MGADRAPAAGDEPAAGPRRGARRPRAGRPSLLLLGLGLLAAASGWACTEDPLTGPGPDEGGGRGSETVEFRIGPEEMARWRDTTYTGFAVPADAGFLLLADEEDFRSRGLLRYRALPDSVPLDSDTLEIEEYRNGRVSFVLDTAPSTVPAAGLTVRVFTLSRNFEPAEATWEQPSDGTSWQSAGGDLEQQVGRRELEGTEDGTVPDTVSVPLGSTTDSLLEAWVASDGRPGVAATVEGEGGRLRARTAVLRFDVKPVDRDTTVGVQAGIFLAGVPSTFIFDPPVPPAGERLRVGGLPASRLYLSFRPPEEVDGVSIPGSTINRAELGFRPAAPPSSPFALRASVVAAGVRLPADPFALGPRTPIGDTLRNGTLTLAPDSLSKGRPMRFALTDLLRRWASDPDSAGDLRLAVRLRPDAQSVGFWEFGSDASPAELEPFLRVILTPASEFDVP